MYRRKAQAKRATRPKTNERTPPAESARVEAEPACEVTAPFELEDGLAWLLMRSVLLLGPRSMTACRVSSSRMISDEPGRRRCWCR